LGRLRFGPAGKPTNFSGDYEEVPPLLRQMGLDALEYEAVRGVRVTKEKAERIREASLSCKGKKFNFSLSCKRGAN